MKSAIKIISAFRLEEDGVALTEYLILLGLLVGSVIISVQLAGINLSAAWATWGSWWTTTVTAPLGINDPLVCCANAQAASVPGNCCN